jgi:hypothetical protein
MNGVALCARFSLATSRRSFCGPDGADALLYRAIGDDAGVPTARDALRRFEALAPYLEAIGAKHGRDPFDPDVVAAYWIGNELLDDFDRADFAALLDRLVRRGLPRSLARSLQDRLPRHPIPHHAFHVAFVGVGNVTGHVATTVANMDACRPSWGDVERVDPTSLVVRSRPLTVAHGRLELGPPVASALPYDPAIVPGLAPGDTIAFHWSTPALRLASSETRRLAKYTARSLEAASEAWEPAGPSSPKGSRSAERSA